MVKTATLSRRGWLAGCAALLTAGCSSVPDAEPVALPGQLQRWRALQGGFLSPTLPPLMPAAGQATGLFVRWIAPGAIALGGGELLVADFAQQRLWRADTQGQLLTGVAGAPVLPGMHLAVGADLSAWLLDAQARQVLRFARDGRLLQTLRLPLQLASPAALLPADGGTVLLIADGIGAAWLELRGSGVARSIAPEDAEGRRIGSIDGLAAGPGGSVYVLDRLGGCVHRVERSGRVMQTLGRGELLQPLALASDGRGRAYVLDGAGAPGGALLRLREAAPARRWSAAELGLQRMAALAADGQQIAIADTLTAQVVLFSVAHDDER